MQAETSHSLSKS